MTNMYKTALSELEGVFDRLNDAEVDKAVQLIADARTTVVFGGGRERLQIMGFAMRLYHLGLSVAVEGDMTTPPVGAGDLFIVTVGPGEISTALALLGVAKAAAASGVPASFAEALFSAAGASSSPPRARIRASRICSFFCSWVTFSPYASLT